MEIEGLIRELASIDHMLFVIGGGDAVSEMYTDGITEPTFDNGYATLESRSWHFHLKMDEVKGVQFVEAEDHGTPMLYYVRFSNATEETLMRCYFPNPYLDENDVAVEFQPDKLRAFEETRDRYVDQKGVVFVRRKREPTQSS